MLIEIYLDPIPLNKDTRSARWVKSEYPKSYPYMTYSVRDDKRVGKFLSLRALSRQVETFRSVLENYYSA